jgi:hypothetical protein
MRWARGARIVGRNGGGGINPLEIRIAVSQSRAQKA